VGGIGGGSGVKDTRGGVEPRQGGKVEKGDGLR